MEHELPYQAMQATQQHYLAHQACGKNLTITVETQFLQQERPYQKTVAGTDISFLNENTCTKEENNEKQIIIAEALNDGSKTKKRGSFAS